MKIESLNRLQHLSQKAAQSISLVRFHKINYSRSNDELDKSLMEACYADFVSCQLEISKIKYQEALGQGDAPVKLRNTEPELAENF